MRCPNKCRVKNYLERFEEILCTMENKMLCAKENEDITKYFIECMIPHHQAAIYMCENLLNYTEYKPLIEIANNIIKMQTNGIKEMKQIYKTTEGYENSAEKTSCYVERYCNITKNMLINMRNSPKCISIDIDFINEMIPHHEGAIYMCKNLLEYNIDSRLIEVANSIIKEQENGVKELKMQLSKL